MRTIRSISTRYDHLSPRTQAVTRRVGPPLFLLCVIGIVFLYHHFEGVTGPLAGRTLLFRVGVGYAIFAFALGIATFRYDLQTLGLLGTSLADAAFLIFIIGGRGHQPPYEWQRDLIQSGFEVGVLFLIGGILLWALTTRFGTRYPHRMGRNGRGKVEATDVQANRPDIREPSG